MILSDREIEAALEHGHITIKPRPGPELWTSTAIDLTLDGILLKWKEPKSKPTGESAKLLPVFPARDGFDVQAMTKDPDLAERIPIPSDGYPLKPLDFVLGFTSQHIFLPHQSRIAARVEGKSSLARIGVGVHVTAPTIHAGFGFNKNTPETPGLPIQLEIFNLGPFIVHLDTWMPICQIILEEVREMPIKGYVGRFSSQESFRLSELNSQ
jgi:dCTP deaminase